MNKKQFFLKYASTNGTVSCQYAWLVTLNICSVLTVRALMCHLREWDDWEPTRESCNNNTQAFSCCVDSSQHLCLRTRYTLTGYAARHTHTHTQPELPSLSAAQRSSIVVWWKLTAEGLTLNRGGCAPLHRLFCLLLLTWETLLLTLSKLNQQFRNCHPNIQEYLLKRLILC